MKKKLIKLLGLEADATEADIYARIGELKALSGNTGKQEIVVSYTQQTGTPFYYEENNPFFRYGTWM